MYVYISISIHKYIYIYIYIYRHTYIHTKIQDNKIGSKYKKTFDKIY